MGRVAALLAFAAVAVTCAHRIPVFTPEASDLHSVDDYDRVLAAVVEHQLPYVPTPFACVAHSLLFDWQPGDGGQLPGNYDPGPTFLRGASRAGRARMLSACRHECCSWIDTATGSAACALKVTINFKSDQRARAFSVLDCCGMLAHQQLELEAEGGSWRVSDAGTRSKIPVYVTCD
jgi:hypothetical protein